MRMRSSTRSAAMAIAAACAGILAMPAFASAAPLGVSVFPHDDQDPNGFGPMGVIEMRAQAGDLPGHVMAASALGDGTYLLTGERGLEISPEGPGEEQDSRCTQLVPTAIRCSLPEGHSSGKLQVRGSRGRDFIDLRGLDGSLWGDVVGQGGADRILGSDGDDFIFGGRGRDVLIGYLGNDTLSGGKQTDVVRSRDGSRDEISCGAGNDRVEKLIRDRHDRRITIVAGGSYVIERLPISC